MLKTPCRQTGDHSGDRTRSSWQYASPGQSPRSRGQIPEGIRRHAAANGLCHYSSRKVTAAPCGCDVPLGKVALRCNGIEEAPGFGSNAIRPFCWTSASFPAVSARSASQRNLKVRRKAAFRSERNRRCRRAQGRWQTQAHGRSHNSTTRTPGEGLLTNRRAARL